MTKLEEAARAIYKECGYREHGQRWGRLNKTERTIFINMVRATLTVIREPDDEMKKAGGLRFYACTHRPDAHMNRLAAASVFEGMIDNILENKK